jgi:hypothetical protein
LLLIRFYASSRGKKQFTRPHQNGALGRTIEKSAAFDNKFFCNFGTFFARISQHVEYQPLMNEKNMTFRHLFANSTDKNAFRAKMPA